MTSLTKYLRRRSQVRSLVRTSVAAADGLNCLRGSWAQDDFHLAESGQRSFSDVDLASKEDERTLEIKRQVISSVLLSKGFPLPVSAHREEELAAVTLEDARVLKIGEYLSKVHGDTSDPEYISYWRAKTVLLLLRLNVHEGYKTISERIGTRDARLAFAVKLGAESVFSVDSARLLIESLGESVSREFLLRCILSNPEVDYRADVASRMNECKSFSPWLRQYMLAKIRIGT